ncbi:MAG: Gfo/Idh/MocA family oxidoreductase [Candidatus Omnitrophota bacterium]
MKATKTTRRSFFKNGAMGAAAFTIVPNSVLVRNGVASPNDKLNLAAIGVGGRGGDDLRNAVSENIVALCDVDSRSAARSFRQFPNAKPFKDFRVMFDQMEKEIDAVLVATPDHCHSVAAMAALKRKKHLFCEKPLCHSIYETRMVTEAARQAGVITQMGNQGHSSDEIRMLCEWIADGVVGEIREVYAWSDRPVGGDPWSMFLVQARPKETPPVPEGLDWDLWLGPVAFRPYHPDYCPTKWRSWLAFGTGAIGDMGCHIMDPAFWAMNLGAPEYVEATTTHWEPEISAETYPRAAIVRYQFPARGIHPPVKLTWFDGRLKPPIPANYINGEKLGGNGAMFVGEKGIILHGSHGAGSLRLEPESLMKEYNRPPATIPRVKGGQGGHVQDWLRACKDGKPSSASFEYGGALTEMALLGVLAMQVKDERLYWDPQHMEIKNNDKANAIVHPTFREGWSL